MRRDLEALGSNVKHIESPDSVLARVGVVESCGLSNRKNGQADSTVGLLEEIEPQAQVFKHGAFDLFHRWVGVFFG